MYVCNKKFIRLTSRYLYVIPKPHVPSPCALPYRSGVNKFYVLKPVEGHHFNRFTVIVNGETPFSGPLKRMNSFYREVKSYVVSETEQKNCTFPFLPWML
jgi:hypothetical protein